MEGSFADAAVNHGFKRARWRRLNNQQIQDLLIATCQNIRLLMRYETRRDAAAMMAGKPIPHLLEADLPPISTNRSKCESVLAGYFILK